MKPADIQWREVETAPEVASDAGYLAVDYIGYIHVTHLSRRVLKDAGWALGWHPMKIDPLYQAKSNVLLDAIAYAIDVVAKRGEDGLIWLDEWRHGDPKAMSELGTWRHVTRGS